MMPAKPQRSGSSSSAGLWLQAACIFAAAVACGVIYNSASPLGVRPDAPQAADDVGTAPAKPAPRAGYFNETISMTLETAPGRAMPPRGISQAPAAGAPQSRIPLLTWPQV